MRKLITLFQLFKWNSNLTIVRNMQYRFNFIAGTIITVLFSLIGPLVQYLLFTQTKGFPYWDFKQIMLFQGVLLFTTGLKNTFLGNTKGQFINLIRRGDFDKFLLKPFPPMVLLMATSFSMDGIGTLITGIVIIVYIAIKIKLTISILAIILFVICVIGGLVFNAALDILHCSLIVLTIADGGFQGIMNAYLRFSEYPLEIYPHHFKLLFITLLPMAIFIYYPTQALLDRVDLMLVYCLIGVIVFFGLSMRLWHLVLRKYVSAGG